jgi:hypothetical protein
MRRISLIVIHCSDSAFGDAALISRWHTDPPPKGNGWSDIGYHFVVLNGQRSLRAPYDPDTDGLVESGRPLERIGSHARGYNRESIGVCLIGGRSRNGQSVKDSWLTEKQTEALFTLLDELLARFPEAKIVGHCELNPAKICPNLNMDTLRARYAAWRKEKIDERNV